jgi:hypothetical protein
MRNIFLVTIMAVVGILITSCSKDNAPDTSSNYVSATISIGNNAPFQVSATGAVVKIYTAISGPSNFRIEAVDPNKNKLFIAVDNVNQAGTYPITGNDGVTGNGVTFIKDLGLTTQVIYWTIDPSITNKGSVTITAFNKHYIEGTFTAICKNENNSSEVAQISNGSFKGNY